MDSSGSGSPRRDRRGFLAGAGRLATGSPRLVIATWLVAVVVLGAIGLGLDEKLSTKAIFIGGTETARQHELAGREFGDDNALFVLLSGSPAAIEREGRELEQGLQGLPQTSVNTPWQRGSAIEGLRPAPDRLALLVAVRRSPGQTYSDLIAPVRRQVDATVGDSVKVSLAGAPVLAESFRTASTGAVAAGEKIALPLLLIILLVVFRSVLAAAIPVIVGGAVVFSSRGLLALLADVVRIDALALAGVGMMGLALGVDYALLIVSRFREELEKRDDVAAAARVTVSATGRSVVPAGCGLLLAMLVASLTLPGPVKSVALAISIASVLSVLSALIVVPAILTLLGRRLDRWALPRRGGERPAGSHWSQRLSRKPVLALPVVALLLLSAAWASTLDSEVGAVAQLPADDPGRIQQEEVQDALGPGWVAPLEVLVAGRGAPVTTEPRLRAMASFQRQVEADPGVATMAGLAPIERRLRPLGDFEGSLAAQRRGLDRLGDGIGRAHEGSEAGTAGLARAVAGARTLGSSLGESEAGAGLLVEGARSASEGSAQLSDGLGRASDGSGELARGARESSTGAGRLTDGISKAAEGSGQAVSTAQVLKDTLRSGTEWLDRLQGPLQSTEAQLAAARGALDRMGVGKDDPEYAAALAAVEAAGRSLTGTDPASGELVDPAYEGVGAGVTHAENQLSAGTYLANQIGKSGRQGREGLEKLARNSARLDRGLQRLSGASEEVSAAIARLSRGGAELSPALLRLSRGTEHLAGGLGSLRGGAEALAGGLDDGASGSQSLTDALGRIDARLADQQREAGSTPGGSPGLFRSGYFYLAGLDGAGHVGRDQAALLVNLDRGGSAARMLVIPDNDPADRDATKDLTERLRDDAGTLARQTGTEVLVGGEGPNTIDIDQALRDSAPGARLALCLVTLLVLIPVTRSLLLPLIAALLNLLTVSATFGLLSLLFNDSLLGGPGYVDTVVIPATIMVIFGLAIDYEVFLFARIREEYLRTGSTETAIANGLGRTAHVITGAAVIMITVFLAFSVSSFATLRNFGVAQAIAVAIDAFAIRLVVLPVAMRALGERCWWIPRWLDRLLPDGGRPAPAGAEAPA